MSMSNDPRDPYDPLNPTGTPTGIPGATPGDAYDKYGNARFEPATGSSNGPMILLGLLAAIGIIGGLLYFNHSPRDRNDQQAQAPITRTLPGQPAPATPGPAMAPTSATPAPSAPAMTPSPATPANPAGATDTK